MNYIKRLLEEICCTDHEETRPKSQNKIKSSLKLNRTQPKRKISNFLMHPNLDAETKEIREYCSYQSESDLGEKPKFSFPKTGKKLLLLDLDKTIIYYDNKIGFVMRPHLKDFLKIISEFYTIGIFTAATQRYLEEMVELIKKQNGGAEYFSGFLTSKNCTKIHRHGQKTLHIKDLSLISEPLSNIVIVDDNPISYVLNPLNAIPIIPFLGVEPDNHLQYLTRTLLELKEYDDVREYIRERYIFEQKKTKIAKNYSVETKESASPKKIEIISEEDCGMASGIRSY